MLQASFLKVLVLSALLAPAMGTSDGVSGQAVSVFCAATAGRPATPLDFQAITVADLQQMAAAEHPVALYWQARQAQRSGHKAQAQALFLQAGRAGSSDAWLRLAEISRQRGDTQRSHAYAQCAIQQSGSTLDA